jgi:hypothetical protein
MSENTISWLEILLSFLLLFIIFIISSGILFLFIRLILKYFRTTPEPDQLISSDQIENILGLTRLKI